MRVLLMFLTVFAIAVVASSADQKPQPSKSAADAKVTASTSPINLNTATQGQLETLPGVGPAAAKRILEYRQKNGNFKKVEDLMNVKGFGEKVFLKLKPLLVVSQKAEPTGGAER